MTTPIGPAPIVPQGRPREVETAFRLYVVDIVLGLLGGVAMFAFLPRLARAVEQQQRSTGVAEGMDAGTITLVTVTVGVAVALVLAAFRLFVAIRMRAGRNWARIVLLVLSALQLALIVYRSNQTVAQFSAGPLGAISAVVDIAALVLLLTATSFLFRPDAIRFFRTQRG